MIRVILFLIIVGALALGVAWLADRPGDVVVTWQGLRIETSLMVLGAALLAAMAVLALLWSLLRAFLRSPSRLRAHLHRRRGERAYEAISRGLIAVGAGDLDRRAQARRRSQAHRAGRAAGAAAQRAICAACRRSRGGRQRLPAPWQAAPIPRRSGCTASSSRRIAAAITPAPARFAEEAARRNPVARLGRQSGARIALRHRRLGRRARAP